MKLVHVSHDYIYICIETHVFSNSLYVKHLANRLPVKEVYTDTDYKTKHSISNSSFKHEVPRTMLMPENKVYYVDHLAIPRNWTTVESFNHKL